MKISITGGAGYIGSVLVPELLRLGHEVSVLDNFYFNQTSLLDCCADKSFRIVRGDARDRDTVARFIEGADFIIPLAALVGFPLCDYDKIAAKSTNLDAVLMLLELRKPEQKIIFPCTNSGYGTSDGSIYCTEDTPLNPISLYGKTKVEAEKAVLDSGNSLTFRFATVFGASPRMRLDLLVNDFVYRAVNDKTMIIFEGSFKRNFIHIRDVVGAYVHAINNFENMKGKTYNCGLSDANLSKIELCEKIQKHLPQFTFFESEFNMDPDKRNYIVSNERLESTGWKPQYSLDDGIEELIKTYSVIKNNSYANF
ncbi:MAG: NAD(P)-dependent oxidoreductase [Clostridia bacterium]|nr:NAD(P)-dependent oxidoreductase [Clostridia bacterium]